jgi:hypothetical protein
LVAQIEDGLEYPVNLLPAQDLEKFMLIVAGGFTRLACHGVHKD